MSEIQLNTIEEAIEDFREGKFLIVVDDEDRENDQLHVVKLTMCIMRPEHGRTLPRVGAGYASCQ